MKQLKRYLSVIAAAALLLGSLSVAVSAEDGGPGPLQFNTDGSFRIIQVSDLQETFTSSTFTLDFLYDLAQRERPDLFVLTGDNIADSGILPIPLLNKALVRSSIGAYMKTFDRIYRDFGIPVTMVLGNHDAEYSGVTRQEEFEIYASHESFIGVAMPEADEGTMSINGPHYGTHNLLIYDKTGKKAIFNLWMFDSGDYAPDYAEGDGLGSKYDCVQQPQVDWFTAKQAKLKLPSLAFQHIIAGEIFDHITQKADGTWTLPASAGGEINETPCPGRNNFGQYAALNKGGCLAIFTGHDHVNTFEITLPGTDLVNSPCTGFGSYGRVDLRGVRSITLRDSDLSRYETELITYESFYEGKLQQARLSMFDALSGWTFFIASLADNLSFRPMLWGAKRLFL